jgi:DNA polymerase-3 subunit gamma/tau
LNKNFAYIRVFIEDVYGLDTEIKFNKLEQTKKELPQSITSDISAVPPLEIVEENESSSMIEDIELGSGCIASMGAQNTPTLSQKELVLEDILNSPFINKAIELFQPETQIRVTSKL